MKYILLVLSVFILAGCQSPEVIEKEVVVTETEIVEVPTVVTETEIIYVDRPLGVTEDELKFYLWYTLEVANESESITLDEDGMTITVETSDGDIETMTLEEYTDILYDYYDYMESWQ